MLTPDQITAIAPDAASLKAGRDLGTSRKWESWGGDDDVLWGLAMGSGKDPYQTRVRLGDLASKCSCPSRKFPCKHAIGLMFLATSHPGPLSGAERPPWVVEWLDSHAAREQKAVARSEQKEAKPVDEKAAAKRRAQRENRLQEGVSLLQRTLLDLTREGLASGVARSASAWENLAKRMVDSQAPALAGTLRHIADTVLADTDVDVEFPFEMGRLHVLLKTFLADGPHDEMLAAEIHHQLGGSGQAAASQTESIDDQWFVLGRTLEERDRLITSSTWIFGEKSRRWARVLRFAPVMQAIADPWPVGSMVHASLKFQQGLYPLRAIQDGDGLASTSQLPAIRETDLGQLLDRFASALAANPFLRALPFFIPLRPSPDMRSLVDVAGGALPLKGAGDLAFRLECICAGNPTPMCGEWDGRRLRLLSILDGDAWISLTPQQP